MKSFLFVCLLAGALCADTLPVSAVPVPVSQKKVEAYVSNLRNDLASQEQILSQYLTKAQSFKSRKEQRLKALIPILSHLQEQLKNTTKFYDVYNKHVDDERRVLKPFTIEYDRAVSLYNSSHVKMQEERMFLDTLAQYIAGSAQFRSKCLKQ